MSLFRDFASLSWDRRLPGGDTFLPFLFGPQEHKLAPQMLAVVNELLGAKRRLLLYGILTIHALWKIPMRSYTHEQLDETKQVEQRIDHLDRIKGSIWPKVEPTFRLIKRQFGRLKILSSGLTKNIARLHTLFALSNLGIARRSLIGEN